jgi:hypothetical protein
MIESIAMGFMGVPGGCGVDGAEPSEASHAATRAASTRKEEPVEASSLHRGMAFLGAEPGGRQLREMLD